MGLFFELKMAPDWGGRGSFRAPHGMNALLLKYKFYLRKWSILGPPRPLVRAVSASFRLRFWTLFGGVFWVILETYFEMVLLFFFFVFFGAFFRGPFSVKGIVFQWRGAHFLNISSSQAPLSGCLSGVHLGSVGLRFWNHFGALFSLLFVSFWARFRHRFLVGFRDFFSK